MGLTVKQVLDYARIIVDNYETEPIEEARTGDELRRALDNGDIGQDARSVFMKTVGRLFRNYAITIEFYDDATGGVIIHCSEHYGCSKYDDGEVFIYQKDTGVIYFSHGRWETVLKSICDNAEKK